MENYDSLSHEPFHPLRLMVKGLAGSGKTVLINTLVTVIQENFGINDAVHVCAPTGSAVSNICGMTIHRLLEVTVHTGLQDLKLELSESRRKALIDRLKQTVAIIVDE